MGQRARIGQGFELLTLLSVQLQRGQGSSQVHRHLHSPQKMPKGKSWRNTSISYLRDTTLATLRLTAEMIENLTALSGVAYEKLGAIFASLVAPTLAPTPMASERLTIG